MPTAAEALYPNGPNSTLGNQQGPARIAWGSLKEDEQKQLMKSAKRLEPGTPESNKFDEALFEHGIIHLPAESDGQPIKYIDSIHNALPSSINRYDLPDGSIILEQPDKKAIS